MSVLKDVVSKLKLHSSLLPALRTADANGAGVDTQGGIGVGVVAHIGTSGDTLSGTVKIDMELEHSDDNSSFTDCADADLSAPVVGANTGTFAHIDDPAEDDLIYKTNYIGSKRYIRVVANYTGTHTNGTPVAAHVILDAVEQPAS